MENLYFGRIPGAPRESRPTICTGCEAVIRKGSPGASPTYGECDKCRSSRANTRIVAKMRTNRIFNPGNKFRENSRRSA